MGEKDLLGEALSARKLTGMVGIRLRLETIEARCECAMWLSRPHEPSHAPADTTGRTGTKRGMCASRDAARSGL